MAELFSALRATDRRPTTIFSKKLKGITTVMGSTEISVIPIDLKRPNSCRPLQLFRCPSEKRFTTSLVSVLLGWSMIIVSKS